MHLTKFHQYIKPRNQNPTYNSSSVGTSLGSFYSTNLTARENYDNPSYSKKENHQSALYKSKVNPQATKAQQYLYKKQGSQILKHYQKMRSQQKQLPLKYNHSSSTPKIGDSRFSRFGNQSLVVPQVSSKQVYDKQAKNYNIISIKPKQIQDTIQKFPKFHLQNQDINFYKKIKLQNEYRDRYNWQMRNKESIKWAEVRKLQNQRRQYQKPAYYDNQMAGMKTDFIPKDLHVKQLHEGN